MAWIYLAESEESQKPWKATSGQSPIVKTTDTLKVCCCHEWLMEGCQERLSGTTLYRLAGPCYQVESTSSMEGSPAKTLVVQDMELVWKESEADYFSRSLGLLAKYDHNSFSWKTFQKLLTEDWEVLSGRLPGWGMTVDGNFYSLPPPTGIRLQRERWFLLAHNSSERRIRMDKNSKKELSRINLQDFKEWRTRPTDISFPMDWPPTEFVRGICRVDNGLREGVDRTHALGNAVVPAQAREAFERLMGLK